MIRRRKTMGIWILIAEAVVGILSAIAFGNDKEK
jgi:hypothetical protein